MAEPEYAYTLEIMGSYTGLELSKDGTAVFTSAGSYFVRAKSGEVCSDWVEITAKTPAQVVSAPIANNRAYDGVARNLVEPGIAVDGDMAYVVNPHEGSVPPEAAPEKTDISGATVNGLATTAYTGKAVTPAISVVLDGKTLEEGTDYTVSYMNNTDVGTAKVTVTGMGDYTGELTKKFLIKQVTLKYRAYLQKKQWSTGWKTAKVSGTSASAMAGLNEGLRMETIQMQMTGIGGEIEYRAYVQKKGWTQWGKATDKSSWTGTKGQSLRLEMIQLKSSGQVASLYDMYYRSYSEKLGWLNWARSGAKAGTAGYGYKLEAFQVNFVRKGETFSLASQNKMKKSFYDKTKDGTDPK